MTIFTLKAYERGRLLTIRMTNHWGIRIFGDIAISYHVAQAGKGSRLIVRMRLRYPRWSPFHLMRYVLPFGDWFMAQRQLRTFRDLAERDARRCVAQQKGWEE